MNLQITNQEIEEAKRVYSSFMVAKITRESALESGIFAVFNQASRWERPSKIIYKMREDCYRGDKSARFRYCSVDLLLDEVRINKIAKKNGWRFHHQNRIREFIDYFGCKSGEWWNDVINADTEYRNAITEEIKFLQCKTFSLWHLCLGGKNLLPIDIHLRRQSRELGIEMPEEYVIGRKRENKKTGVTQTVVNEPGKSKYLELEKKIIELFAEDERFLLNGKIDLGLVASVLWWKGANRNQQGQGCLFGNGIHSIILPYGQGIC